jgi:hypothetical protein
LAKDPLYQLQAVLLGDVVLKMSFVKLFLLLLVLVIIPFCARSIKLSKINVCLFIFVLYNFCAITFINNDFPINNRLTIYYISMFLPLLLLIANLFKIAPGRISVLTGKILFSSFVLFTLLNCLVGIYQAIRGAEYYAPFFGVELLGITPARVMNVKEQTRCMGFFLDGVQYGLFLNFALFFFLSLAALRQRYRYLLLMPLLLVNIYLTYTRSVYLFTLLNLALFGLIVSWINRGSLAHYLSVKYYWIASTLAAIGVYLYGLTMEESLFTSSLLIRFQSARFILENLTDSYRKFFFGIGYIQSGGLFEGFVPDNFMLALAALGGILGLALFMAIFIILNNKIIKMREYYFDQPFCLTSYLFFSNILAFGMFTNYLDSIFMFLAIPIVYVAHHDSIKCTSQSLITSVTNRSASGDLVLEDERL